MNFGLTGIGIGGLFYIGCAVVILIREGSSKIFTRYHTHPRQLLADISLILAGILGATLATDIGLDRVMHYIASYQYPFVAQSIQVPTTGLLEVRSIVVAVVILLVVLALANVLRFVISTKTHKRTP